MRLEWRNVNDVKAIQYWEEMYDAAIQNTSEHGNASKVLHAVVMENGKKLGQWISQQRGIRKGVQKPSIDIMTFEELGIERLGKSSID